MKLRLGLSVLAALACVFGGAADASAAKHAPKVKHVFTIVLENKNYDATFGDAATEAPYLARKLPAKGRLLSQYHGTGHFSLGNYITLISGQSENPVTQADCTGGFNDVTPGTIGADGQALGAGCVYSPQVRTVADQLEAAGKTWRGYMEDMGKDPSRDGRDDLCAPCDRDRRRRPEGNGDRPVRDQAQPVHVLPLGHRRRRRLRRPRRQPEAAAPRSPQAEAHPQLQLHHARSVQRRPRRDLREPFPARRISRGSTTS